MQGIINQTKEDLRTLDEKTIKLLTIYRAFHPQANLIGYSNFQKNRWWERLVDC